MGISIFRNQTVILKLISHILNLQEKGRTGLTSITTQASIP